MGATPVDLPDAGDLPKLTHKQFAFVRAIAGGATQSDAYRQAYDCSNSTDPSVWCNASKLAADAKVMQWLCHLRRLGMAGARLTLEGHLSELERLKHVSLDTGNCGAAVKAEELRGKASGLYVDRIETYTAAESELLAALKALPEHLQA